MKTNCTLVLAAAVAMLSSPVTGQTWTRDVDGWALSSSPITAHRTGFGLTRQNDDGITHVEFDAQGDVTTSVHLTGFVGHLSLGGAVRLDDDTFVLMGSQDYKPWVARIDPATGATLWDRTPSSVDARLSAACRNDIGHVVVVGSGKLPSENVTRPYLCALSATGGVHYRRYYGSGATSEIARGVVKLAGGGMVLLSQTLDAYADQRTARLTWLNDWGHVQFGRLLSSPVAGFESKVLLALPDGGVLVAGGVFENGGTANYFAIRFDATGAVTWQRYYDTYGSASIFADPVAAGVRHPDGGFAFAVHQRRPAAPGGSTHHDMGILRIDDNGAPLWLRTFGVPELDEAATGFDLTPDGGFVLAGGEWYGPIHMHRVRADGTSEHCPNDVDQPFAAPGEIVVQYDFQNYINDPGMLLDYHAAPQALATTVTEVCGQSCEVSGSTFGAGVAGTGGKVPSLQPVSGACLGWNPELRVENGLAGAIGILGFSTATVNTPLFGGMAYLDIGSFWTVTVLLDGAGQATFPLALDWTPFPGVTLYAQGLFLDPGAPFDLSMTNAAALSVL